MRWALDRSSVGAAVIANVDNHLFSKQSFFLFAPGARLGVPEHDDVVMTRIFIYIKLNEEDNCAINIEAVQVQSNGRRMITMLGDRGVEFI
jgi:hypothetical protein